MTAPRPVGLRRAGPAPHHPTVAAVGSRRWLLAVAAAVLAAAAGWALRPDPAPRRAPTATPGRPPTVVFLGDSITSGHRLPVEEAYPHRLREALGVEVVNAGISGDTTGGGLIRLETDVLAHAPRLVVVELGVNDAFSRQPRETTVANLRAITRRIRETGAAVVLVHISLPTLAGDGYRADLREIARAEGATLVEDFLQGVVPGHTYDGLHPDAAGQARLAERLLPVLRAQLGG